MLQSAQRGGPSSCLVLSALRADGGFAATASSLSEKSLRLFLCTLYERHSPSSARYATFATPLTRRPRMRVVSHVICVLALFVVALGAQPAPLKADALGVPELLKQFNVPAVSVAVIRDFNIEWVRAWGVKSVKTGEPATVDTLFQAASISKPVAAMASLRAIQDGRFGLDQDINTILKSWKVPDTPHVKGVLVTPRMLMSHTSGTDDGFGFPGYPPDEPRPSIVQILDGQAPSNRVAVQWGRPPMAGYKYSGGAVTI